MAMSQHIVTVRGRVTPESLGIVDAHSHVWIDPVAGADPTAPVLNDEAAITAGLLAFRAAGGGGIVDCQPPGAGRSSSRLWRLSGAAGVPIIACTGFHLRRYYAEGSTPLWHMTAEAACDFFLDEWQHGTLESRGTDAVVYPGFIKIAAESTLAACPLPLFEAAVAASNATGCAIQMHTERGTAIEDCLAFLLSRGAAPARLVFCHVDKRPDFGLHRDMAEAGVLLEYDTFLREKYDPERGAWPLVFQMVEAGLADHLALATDMAQGEWWPQIGGGPGPAALVTHIQARLLDAGLDTAAIGQLLGGTITARLAIPD